MKKILWIFILITGFIQAQIENPIHWKSEIKHLKDKEYVAVFTANIENNWHLYSADAEEGIVIPTTFTFIPNPNIKLIGKTQEVGQKIKEYSQAFKANIVYYKNKVEYHQKFEILKDIPLNLEADVDYQLCNDKICLSPDGESFILKIEPEKNFAISKQSNKEVNEIVTPSKSIVKDTLSSKNNPEIEEVKNISNTPDSENKNIIIANLDVDNPINKECGDKIIQNEGYLWIFIFGFLGGLIALLTPCVYPMIPLTISYFTKNSNKNGKRDALIYAFFILFIFIIFTLPFHLINGINSDIFNQISTNVWLNLAFFIVFIVFAFSFFGFYDITLPSWMANKSDRASESGGILGLFFMALTLVIVSFSCTGPVLGSILAQSIQNPTQLTMAFSGCGLAWALVFGGFALFPNLLKSMPKSGGWMNTIKVVLGFVELALAFKFLSKADLVAKTFLLKREIFIAIWIIIAFATALYLLGFIKFPHDSKKSKIGTSRKIWSCLFFLIGIYLIPGLFPSQKPNLKLLSGLTPPLNVSIYKKDKEQGILGLSIQHDYFEALKIAKEQNKPILVDFTGFGCENCRKMEEFVWSEADIWQILNNDVIIASLYVDDSESLPEEEQIVVQLKDGRSRKIKTIGNKWSVFQKENFNSNSQPFYVLVTPDNQILNYPVAGYMKKEDFKKFLQCGIQTFKNLKK